MAEQIPLKLTPDAIKNTNLKIIHRLVAEDDRRAVGSAMNLGEAQIRALATLERGVGAVGMERMQKAVLVRVPLSPAKSSGGSITSPEVKQVMCPYHAENAERLLPHPGCAECPTANPGGNCGRHVGECTNVHARDAFVRLLNAMRLNKATLLDALSAFSENTDRESCQGEPNDAYCLFVELTENDVERRGEFAGWPHEDVERFILLACKVVSTLVRELGKSARAAVEKACAKDLLALSGLTRRLHKTDPLPFPGCRSCLEPCHYRFDMQGGRHPVDAADFREAFFDSKTGNDALSRIPWETSARCFSLSDVRSRRGGALCFAVQQFNELGFSRARQEELTHQIAEALSQLTT